MFSGRKLEQDAKKAGKSSEDSMLKQFTKSCLAFEQNVNI